MIKFTLHPRSYDWRWIPTTDTVTDSGSRATATDPTGGRDRGTPARYADAIEGGPVTQHARAVIIGGGVGGTSIAYHLAERGWTDIVLVDRAELTSGSTFHSAGLVGQLRGSVTLTKMMMYGADLYGAPRGGDRRRPVVAPGRVAPPGLVARRGSRSSSARPAGARRSGCRSS